MLKLTSVLALLAVAPVAHASTHKIDIAPVRAFVQNKLVNTKSNTLKLVHKLNTAKLPSGVTAAAALKATQTLKGMTGFNSGTKAGNYYAVMGKEKILITASTSGQKVSGIGFETAGPTQQFVIRSAKQGLVIARGMLDKGTGKITFTRSHNEHSPATPAETIAK